MKADNLDAPSREAVREYYRVLTDLYQETITHREVWDEHRECCNLPAYAPVADNTISQAMPDLDLPDVAHINNLLREYADDAKMLDKVRQVLGETAAQQTAQQLRQAVPALTERLQELRPLREAIDRLRAHEKRREEIAQQARATRKKAEEVGWDQYSLLAHQRAGGGLIVTIRYEDLPEETVVIPRDELRGLDRTTADVVIDDWIQALGSKNQRHEFDEEDLAEILHDEDADTDA